MLEMIKRIKFRRRQEFISSGEIRKRHRTFLGGLASKPRGPGKGQKEESRCKKSEKITPHFYIFNIIVEWQGSEENEIGVDSKTGKKIIGIDENYYRPTEVEQLLGDATKAKEKLGWEHKTSFEELVKIMANSDWERVKRKGY